MPRTAPAEARSTRSAPARTVPVLAVLVCHNGEPWLRETLSALRRSTARPRHVLAVDNGSADGTARLLSEAEADGTLSGVITQGRDNGFAQAVATAVDQASERWGETDSWLWVLHDDCVPDPHCLATLLSATELSPSAGVLGPLALDWNDPRLVVEAGLSTDASGHRQTGIGPAELDWELLRDTDDGERDEPTDRFEQSSEVLAVSSAGMLIRRELWHDSGGFDSAYSLFGEDIDFGWRVNQAGGLVLCVPTARMRHARATSTGHRTPRAMGRTGARSVARAHGLRTFLVNCGRLSFVLGMPRLLLLCLLRALGFGLLRRGTEASAELHAFGYLLSGRAGLRSARRARRSSKGPGTVSGLFTSRFTRLRNGLRGGVLHLVRRRLEGDATLGRLPEAAGAESVWTLPGDTDDPASAVRRPVGPAALPAGAVGKSATHRHGAGLRRPATTLAVPVQLDPAQLDTDGTNDTDAEGGAKPPAGARPSPGSAQGGEPRRPDLVFVELGVRRVLAVTLFAPPVLLVLGLTAIALLANAGRLGLDLAGGRVLPVSGLGETWSQYLAAWHPVAGGTSAQAPAALAVLGVLGAVFTPIGGPPAALAVLLLGAAPLAGLSAYVATRKLPVNRWIRTLAAAAYALLPPATAAVSQGRPDVVVAHILLPLVLAGVLAVLNPGGRRTWLSTATLCSLGVALIGAFSPLVHVLVLLVVLLGFVLVPSATAHGGRRVAGLCLVVLLPIALLLPWPVALVSDPALVLHGTGAWAAEPRPSIFELLSLHPGGPGAWPGLGLVAALAAVAALVLRPSRQALPGLGLAALGVAALALSQLVRLEPVPGGQPQAGWPGAAMIVIGAGLLWTVLGCARPGAPARSRLFQRGVAIAGVLALLAMAGSAVLAGSQGPLRADGGFRLASSLTDELETTGRSVLVLPRGDEPVRQIGGRLPAFGDDDLAPVGSAAQRLRGYDRDMRSGSATEARAAIAFAAASGVLFVVLPDEQSAQRLRAVAGDITAAAPSTSDGRGVVRLLPTSGRAMLISAELASRAVRDGVPPTETDGTGVAPVNAAPPEVAVRTSDGAAGRLLVLAAEEEAGWQATVNGERKPIVRAWDHQVAVEVPTRAAEIVVTYPSGLRSMSLLVQAAAALFTLLTVVPSRGAAGGGGRTTRR